MKKVKRIVALILAMMMVFIFMALSAAAVQFEGDEYHVCSVEHEDNVEPARAYPCYNCPTGLMTKRMGTLSNGTVFYYYKCNVCGAIGDYT